MKDLPVYQCQKKILETDLDFYGHVNNARYLSMFEEARWEIITDHGFGFREIQKEKIGPVILRVDLRYKKELQCRENITITTEFTSDIAKVMTLRQKILKEDGSVACVADFTYAVWDLRERKIIFPPDSWLQAVGLAKQRGQEQKNTEHP